MLCKNTVFGYPYSLIATLHRDRGDNKTHSRYRCQRARTHTAGKHRPGRRDLDDNVVSRGHIVQVPYGRGGQGERLSARPGACLPRRAMMPSSRCGRRYNTNNNVAMSRGAQRRNAFPSCFPSFSPRPSFRFSLPSADHDLTQSKRACPVRSSRRRARTRRPLVCRRRRARKATAEKARVVGRIKNTRMNV